jgi:predicted phosphodiesterase
LLECDSGTPPTYCASRDLEGSRPSSDPKRRRWPSAGCAWALVALVEVRGPGLTTAAAAAADQATPSFSVLAIGDTGARTLDLHHNALGINRYAKRTKSNALVFLGDNLYPTGFSDLDAGKRERKFKRIYGLFNFERLGCRLGLDEGADVTARWESEKDTCRVFAVAGNHDYYTDAAKELTKIDILPLGFSSAGNVFEAQRKEWRYSYGEPRTMCWSIPGAAALGPDGKPNKTAIYAIFLDSNLLVRATEKEERPARHPDAECWSGSADRRVDCLSKPYRDRILETFEDALAHPPPACSSAWTVVFAHHPLHTVGKHAGAVWRSGTEPSLQSQPAASSNADSRRGYVRFDDLCSLAHRPLDWVKQHIDPEDDCAASAYRTDILNAISRAKRRVDVWVAGHDHSLQMLKCQKFRHDEDADHLAFLATEAVKSHPQAAPRARNGLRRPRWGGAGVDRSPDGFTWSSLRATSASDSCRGARTLQPPLPGVVTFEWIPRASSP